MKIELRIQQYHSRRTHRHTDTQSGFLSSLSELKSFGLEGWFQIKHRLILIILRFDIEPDKLGNINNRYYNGSNIYYNLFMGNTKSGCKIPCSMTKVKNIVMDEYFEYITPNFP